jgi:pimeloyl-ACP methyl ester carboxylesterase
MMRVGVAAALLAGTWGARVLAGVDDGDRILTIDHYVRVSSTVPAMTGQPAQLYVRERVTAGAALRARSFADRVVLFVHGAGTPAEVSFDVPYEDYSWMEYLARAGFDVFSVDMTGYGRSTRPAAMSDPCNLAADKQAAFVPTLIPAPCPPTYPGAMTTIGSDWADVGAAVDYVRELRRVPRVSLVAWSLGGPRSGGYAARYPDKVGRIVWLAPAYTRESPAAAPAKLPVTGTVFNTQSRAEFLANWDRQVGCPGQYDPAAADAVSSAMMESDPVGATWGPGVRRAPQTTTWGWNAGVVSKMTVPALLVAGAHDKQVDPARVKELYQDLGSTQKVFIDLGCAGHSAMWEKAAHAHLFRASLEWLEKGTVNGSQSGTFRMGY